MHDEDLLLAHKLIAGDAATFSQFFEDYFPRLFRFILRRTNRDAALPTVLFAGACD